MGKKTTKTLKKLTSATDEKSGGADARHGAVNRDWLDRLNHLSGKT
ncbi:MAG: hypothetical protein NC430_08095 [bacterium]|nr:hypothetical protein [bacterium]